MYCSVSVSLYVGNLSFHTTEESLQGLFEDNGLTPTSVRLITRNGESRGYSLFCFSFLCVKILISCTCKLFSPKQGQCNIVEQEIRSLTRVLNNDGKHEFKAGNLSFHFLKVNLGPKNVKICHE